CMTGGMPESQFLVIAFGWLYACFRLIAGPELRERWLARLVKLALATALGFALSGFLLLPFLEFLLFSHNVHQSGNVGGNIVGLEFDHFAPGLITYLLPLVFGRLNDSILSGSPGWTGMRGYWGVLPCLFATSAIVCCVALNRENWPKSLRWLTLFFAAA